VLITNLTDAPGKDPIQVDIYNKTLDPGTHIKLPADLVNGKIRALENSGLISIGNLPPWYVAAKKRKGRELTAEEKEKMQVTAPAPTLKASKAKDTEVREEQLKSTKG
jgi:hypothetical protein